MPLDSGVAGRGRGGSEGVLVRLRGPEDVFEAASKGAARRLRDEAIPDTGEFDDNGTFAVIVKWRSREVWQVRHDGAWRDVCFNHDA